ncbi:hypothetical protein F2Q69_00011135 [Brassica cretica]|uniref:Disease resistance protein winged helix domain-containing protein n=1 Tax=Brassica cretica TaxID=69181 RepID=A0A8S9R0Q2_BRACR|nr:hypothetical protein F2Q69_00011135 [Brassica cretica]
MGRKMVTYCGGLPLAVTVLGGLLVNKNMVEEWERVDDNIQSQIVHKNDKSQNSVCGVLSMSYEDLPMQLKHCFLYLAHFPEDYKIQVERLYYLWEAEGIITSSGDGETTRKIGEEYIDELVRRNMVIAVKEDLSCRWEYCQMHDMMREVCLYKAKEENFLQFINVPTTSTSTINAHTPTRSRRLAVYGGNALDIMGYQKARSVLGFGLDSQLWKQSGQGLRNLQLLRVLDLNLDDKSDDRGGRIPSSIGKLIHLRYLSLDMGHATLQEDLTLIDENNESDVDFVWNFIHLRYLELHIHMTKLPDHSRFPPHLAHISLSDCEMEEDPLQILEKSVELYYSAFVGRKMVCSKGGFPQLCKLEICCLDNLEEWIVEERSMPCLRTFSILYCEKLKELPEGLKYITSLKELKITDKNKEWKTKLVPGGESYHKVQHIPSVQLNYEGHE